MIRRRLLTCLAATLLVARLPAGNFQQRIDMGEPACGAAWRIPTEGRSCVSTEQRENLEAILRQCRKEDL
jgi:hypothetical protein